MRFKDDTNSGITTRILQAGKSRKVEVTLPDCTKLDVSPQVGLELARALFVNCIKASDATPNGRLAAGLQAKLLIKQTRDAIDELAERAQSRD